MALGSRIYQWDPEVNLDWRRVVDLEDTVLTVTRIAVSPDGSKIAIVGDPIPRSSRKSQGGIRRKVGRSNGTERRAPSSRAARRGRREDALVLANRLKDSARREVVLIIYLYAGDHEQADSILTSIAAEERKAWAEIIALFREDLSVSYAKARKLTGDDRRQAVLGIVSRMSEVEIRGARRWKVSASFEGQGTAVTE